MAPPLQELMDQLEAQREKLIQSIRELSDAQLTHSPGPGKWSTAQVFSHIIAAERLSVSYLQKKLAGIDMAGRSGLWETIKIGTLIISHRMPGLKFKAPKRVVENTTEFTDLKTIESSWSQTRSDLRGLLEKIPAEKTDRLIYKHPVAGYLNIRQALIFLREHVIHHTIQLKRLRKQTPST